MRPLLSIAATAALSITLSGPPTASAAPPKRAPAAAPKRGPAPKRPPKDASKKTVPEPAPTAVPAPPPPPSAPAPPPSAEELDEAEKKEESRKHFDKGFSLLEQNAFAPALAEFQLSRKLYPSWAATSYAASCMRSLQRFDESLEMFEILLRDFDKKLPPDEKTEAQNSIDALRGLVGTIEVTGAKPGASIVIDGRARGDYPPIDPIRVSVGTHMLRVMKEGYAPFETRVDVAGRQSVTVSAQLLVLTDAGRLKVVEQTGKTVDVVLDSVTVGQTPWEGDLSAGDHMVVLRGEGSFGTAPASASIKARQLSTLSLRVEELDATLRIDPVPIGASVTLDGVSVGHGTWEGPLRSGPHRLEVRAEGFLPTKKPINLTRGQQEQLVITLARDEDAELWKKPSKFIFDVDAGFAVAPLSFGGDVAGACGTGCSRSVGIGGLGLFHAGYELESGFGLGVTLGYLIAYQQITGRSSTIVPVVEQMASKGTVNDQLRLTSFVGGVTLGYHRGEGFPLSGRVGAGVVQGVVRDRRSGTFTSEEGMQFKSPALEDWPSATYFYIDPELRLGVRLNERFELGFGAHGLVLIALPQPRFDPKHEISTTAPRSNWTYPEDAVTGRVLFFLVPSVSLRAAF